MNLKIPRRLGGLEYNANPHKKLHDSAVVPQYQTEQSAGMDVAACIDEPNDNCATRQGNYPYGVCDCLAPGYEARIRGRSGMAAKFGIMPANGVGTIDADYRGEVG